MAQHSLATAFLCSISEFNAIVPKLVVQVENSEATKEPCSLSTTLFRIVPVTADDLNDAIGYEQSERD